MHRFTGGMAAGLLELAMWWADQYWPFATLTTLIGTCTACNSGLAAPFTSWLWSQPLWLLVACTGLALRCVPRRRLRTCEACLAGLRWSNPG